MVPVTPGLVRSYSDYMHSEYGDVGSDYVFVNLWGGRIGAPLTYSAVDKLVGQIRSHTGIAFTLHMLRHTHATELIRWAWRSRWWPGCSHIGLRPPRARPTCTSTSPTSGPPCSGPACGARQEKSYE